VLLSSLKVGSCPLTGTHLITFVNFYGKESYYYISQDLFLRLILYTKNIWGFHYKTLQNPQFTDSVSSSLVERKIFFSQTDVYFSSMKEHIRILQVLDLNHDSQHKLAKAQFYYISHRGC
jgi:hypothetical protein